jgi:hypothetical protein
MTPLGLCSSDDGRKLDRRFSLWIDSRKERLEFSFDGIAKKKRNLEESYD